MQENVKSHSAEFSQMSTAQLNLSSLEISQKQPQTCRGHGLAASEHLGDHVP